VQHAGGGCRVIDAPAVAAGRPISEWVVGRQGRLVVYLYGGGPRLALLLQLNGHVGTLLMNREMLDPEGMRVGMGWALALAEFGADGYYAMFAEYPS